jgi:hypothetical protein
MTLPSWEAVNREGIVASTDRMKVAGGWLYRSRLHCAEYDSLAMVFVPEPTPVTRHPSSPVKTIRAKKQQG